ncbi:hypothetical protein H0I23_14485 [Cellulophaga sp. HaHaR_3_176]|uniref:hypothetical protein n=1 Tax=Cellulophaga sp. HaHaR_3_176 TaxID=1942464 RepID=UPI001C201565|nr:hypothetical protein [Cellulophaga sp. HaHaR_3_176]QWX83644.1 hypothetical protein H0I23_14485 [Cellulophaga sp. HaHaR_3_176]
MTSVEKRNILFEGLTAVLKQKGYKLFKTGGDPCFIYFEDKIAIKIGFSFFKIGNITFSSFGITHYEVEDYILDLNYFQDIFKEKKRHHLPTVYDWTSKGPFGFNANTPEEIEKGIEQIKSYINGDGQAFLDKYMYIPNILKRMDELEAKNIDWQDRNNGGILAGTLDAEFRGLIISKLCNDPNYDFKLAMINEVFEKSNYADWKPYYEKLKLVLPTIEPKYNLGVINS